MKHLISIAKDTPCNQPQDGVYVSIKFTALCFVWDGAHPTPVPLFLLCMSTWYFDHQNYFHVPTILYRQYPPFLQSDQLLTI